MKKTMLATILLCSSVAVFAAGPMKPGLWEMTIKSDAMKNMPKMSPEQMEKMKQLGVAMPQMQDGSMVTKVCISKEMADRDQPPEIEHKETGCEARNYQRSGSGYSVDIICDGPNMKGQGKAQGTFSGGENFTSNYDFKGTMRGRPVNLHHESKGKWLSADCGNVKPVDQLGNFGHMGKK